MEAIRSLFFLLVIAIPLSLVGLVIVGGADGAYEYERLIRIDARRNQVFEWLVDPELRTKWKENLVHSSFAHTLDRNDGIALIEVYEVDNEKETRRIEQLRYVEGERVTYRTQLPGAELIVHYSLGRGTTGKASLLKARYEIQWEGRMALVIEPILATQLRSQIDQELERLRRAIETRALN